MIIIGENINATRKSIAHAINEKNREEIVNQIQSQDKAGVNYIDLNAGSSEGSNDIEIVNMKWLIDIALECTEKKICIDSSSSDVIKDAASYLNNRREWMINSVKLDEKILEAIFPLVKEFNVPVIALAMDNNGIPETAEERLNVCKQIYAYAKETDVPPENLYFDPLILPLSANHENAKISLDTIRLIKENLSPAKTAIGTSNVSYGLKKRVNINQAFLIGAILSGVDSAICDPTKEAMQKALILGNLMAGKDKYCRGYSRAIRNNLF